MLLAILLYLLDRIGHVGRQYLPFMLFQHGNFCATTPAVHHLRHWIDYGRFATNRKKPTSLTCKLTIVVKPINDVLQFRKLVL
jgi:hypothetical protein